MADFVIKFEEQRYNINKWRNYKNKWRDNLGLDTTSNKLILDYGCGFGIESLQFAKNKNSVILADINLNNIIAATKAPDILEKIFLTKYFEIKPIIITLPHVKIIVL